MHVKSNCIISSIKRVLFFLLFSVSLFAKSAVADIQEHEVAGQIKKIMKLHPSYRVWNEKLVERLCISFLQEIDPGKVCFVQEEIDDLLHLEENSTRKIVQELSRGNFSFFRSIFASMPQRVERLRKIHAKIEEEQTKEQIGSIKESSSDAEELDTWAKNSDDLFSRIVRINALQKEAISHLKSDAEQAQALYSIKKSQREYEHIMTPDPASELFKKTFCTYLLKSFCQALDSESFFLSPREVERHKIQLQQHLFGIGVLLREECDGLTIIEIMEKSPALKSNNIFIEDKIIAVDGISLIGMNIEDATALIRGRPGTDVQLKIVRKEKEQQPVVLDITLRRSKIILNSDRVKASIEKGVKGDILLLELPIFYQEGDSSSYDDLLFEIKKAKRENSIEGVILDLRNNGGGFLSQSILISSLFLDKGIIASVKDVQHSICHFRNLDKEPVWRGPLVVLVNRASASASEIVAQTLQDWGRAIIVGDDRTFGKGSFQIFVDDWVQDCANTKGGLKITLGRYYTVSGKSPQLVGVVPDIEVPGNHRFMNIGERFLRFPLPADSIEPHFIDRFEDISVFHRRSAKKIYLNGYQVRQNRLEAYIPLLQKRSFERISKDQEYRDAIALYQTVGDTKEIESSKWASFQGVEVVKEDLGSKKDCQLEETISILQDLIDCESYGADFSQ